MRIAYLADPTSINGIYRATLPMTGLERLRGHDVRRLFTDDAQPLAQPLDDVEVVFIHRYCDRRTQKLVQEAHAAGAAVLWDNDDDFGSMPRSSVTYKHFGGMAWERRKAQMQRVFAFTDLATAPSTVLAGRLGEWGASATDVIENHVADPCFDITQRPHSGIVIGWIAGLEHMMDVRLLPICDVLQRILDERADVRVVSVGMRLGLRGDRYEHNEGVELRDISQTASEFDIAIAPLADNDFNAARSNIKLKEYAAGGTPWLASPVGPYASLGERQGGRLVADDDWHEALTRLVDRPRERRRLAKRAARWAAGEALSKNLAVWERMCATAIELRRRRAMDGGVSGGRHLSA
jgi:hypothetical protein